MAKQREVEERFRGYHMGLFPFSVMLLWIPALMTVMQNLWVVVVMTKTIQKIILAVPLCNFFPPTYLGLF